MHLTTVLEVDTSKPANLLKAQGWYVYFSGIHVMVARATGASNSNNVDNGQTQLLTQSIVNTAF